MLGVLAMGNGTGESSNGRGIWRAQVTAGNVINAGILVAAVITLILQFNGAVSALESRLAAVSARVDMIAEQTKQLEYWQRYLYQQQKGGGQPQ